MPYHEANPKVWELFERYTLAAIKRGHKKFSATFIFNVIRWEERLTTDDDLGFKINNNAAAFYPRLFHMRYPQHNGIFELRKSKYDILFGHG